MSQLGRDSKSFALIGLEELVTQLATEKCVLAAQLAQLSVNYFC